MKIQIDTKEKTIKVEETVKFSELIKVLNKLLPKEWKEYSLQSNAVIYWSQPYTWYYSQIVPLTGTIITQGTSTGYINCTTFTNCSSSSVPSENHVYNIEVLN